jgi:uncharacterized protein
MTRTLSLLVLAGTTLALSACDQLHVEQVDGRGMTALMYAAERADSAEVALMIAGGAAVNARVMRRDLRELVAMATREELPTPAPPEWTPLLFATRDSTRSTARHAVARLLIAAGANVNYETPRTGETALRFAIRRSNDAAMTRLLIASGARADAPLFRWAVANAKPEIVGLLLSGRADSSMRAAADAQPFAPVLIDAVKRGDTAVVRMLVNAGFKANARDRNGWTALTWARDAQLKNASPSAAQIALLLQTAGARDDGSVKALALRDAIERKDLEGVRRALKAGANPNARDNSSVPLLVRAAEMGQAEIVSALIEGGAHLNMTPEFGATPLTAAIQNGHVETVKRLLAAGARADQRDSKGMRPLMLAAIWGRGEITALLLADSVAMDPRALSAAAYNGDSAQVRMMLAYGADPNAGRALLGAVRGCRRRDNTPIVRMLLLRGAQPKVEDDGYGLLPRAATDCSATALQMLIQHGADVNRGDFFGRTALMAAAKAKRLDNVRLLIAAGADVNARDNEGRNALYQTRDSTVRQELLRAGARFLAESR